MYQQIIVIGSGRVASRTLEAVLRQPQCPPVVAVEPEAPLTNALGAVCRRQGIPFFRISERPALVKFFDKLPGSSLVLSAHNMFIFPPALVDHGRLTIVNFHNSLLPRQRGRNAPSWALFDQDPWAGVTWHRVSAAIDEGHILCQRRVQPEWNMTALGLTQTLADLGTSVLESLLPGLLTGELHSIPPDPNLVPSFHHSTEVPNRGLFDLDWSLIQASAFLRALDFGKLPLFPQPRVWLDGRERLITGYQLVHEADQACGSATTSHEPHELRYCDSDLSLTVTLAGSDATSRQLQPVLSRGATA